VVPFRQATTRNLLRAAAAGLLDFRADRTYSVVTLWLEGRRPANAFDSLEARKIFGCLGALYAPKQTLDVRDSPRVFPLAAEETALSLARALAGRRRSRGALRAPPPGRCGEGAGPPAGAGPG